MPSYVQKVEGQLGAENGGSAVVGLSMASLKSEVLRIDSLKSRALMRLAIYSLPPNIRGRVVLEGLESSQFPDVWLKVWQTLEARSRKRQSALKPKTQEVTVNLSNGRGVLRSVNALLRPLGLRVLLHKPGSQDPTIQLAVHDISS